MIPSRAQAETLLMNAATNKGRLIERLDTLKRKVKLEMDAVASNKVDPETDRGYTYYKGERKRVSGKMDIENGLLDSKLQNLQAKKMAFSESIEAKIKELESRNATFSDIIDAQIEALSNKRDSIDTKLRAEDMRYFSEMERIREKLENPEPNTASFKKLKSDISILEQDIIDAEKKYDELLLLHTAATEKDNKRLQKEAADKQREEDRKEALARADALKVIEARNEQIRKEEDERNKKRVEDAKKALESPTEVKPAPKKERIELPLIAGKEYSYNQLCSVIEDDLSEKQLEIYEIAYAAATKREKILGWWDNPRNREE